MSKVKDLGAILPPEMQEMQAQPLEAYYETPLDFHGARDVTGKNGPYKRISVSLPDDPNIFILSTGASQPMQVLDWAEKTNNFPFRAQFVKVDRAIILKGIS